MTRQEMLNIIYKKIANKELSFGCKIEYFNNSMTGKLYYIKEKEYDKDTKRYNFIGGKSSFTLDEKELKEDVDIIGHPVMLGDVLDYLEKEPSIGDKPYCVTNILNVWRYKRKPIGKQSKECVKYIYNLINKVKKYL